MRGCALELRHRDGHSTSVLYDGSLYRDADGNVIGVVAATRPISTYAGKSLAAPPDPRVVRHLSLFVGFASLFSVAVGLLSLAGLTFRIAVLKSIMPGQPVIKMNAAVCLVLLGLSLWLLRADDHQPLWSAGRLCGQLMAAITAFVGLLEPDRTHDRLGPGDRPTAVPRTRRGRFLQCSSRPDRPDHGSGFSFVGACAALAGPGNIVEIAALLASSVPRLFDGDPCYRWAP